MHPPRRQVVVVAAETRANALAKKAKALAKECIKYSPKYPIAKRKYKSKKKYLE